MANPEDQKSRVRQPDSKSGEVLKQLWPVLVGLLMGVGTSIGLLLSPLQSIVFNWLWKENPSISVSLDDTSGVVEGDVVGVNVVISPTTVVGLSPGTLTVTLDGGADARLRRLEDDREEVATFTIPLERSDAPHVKRLRVVARAPGQVTIRALASSPRWTESAEQTARLEVGPRPKEKCRWDVKEKYRSFTGDWTFNVSNYGEVKLTVQEDGHQQLTGVFASSNGERGKLAESKRDGDWFGGALVFDQSPLKRVWFEANYERSSDGGFVRSKNGVFNQQTRASAKLHNWKTDEKLTFFGFCGLM